MATQTKCIISGTVDEHSKSLKTFEGVYEGNRLDYESTEYKVNWDCEIDETFKKFDTPDNVYRKIIYKLDSFSDVNLPNDIPTPESYPYTGRGFTGSRNIVLPEWKQAEREYIHGDLLNICDAKTGKMVEQYKFKKSMLNSSKPGKWIRLK